MTVKLVSADVFHSRALSAQRDVKAAQTSQDQGRELNKQAEIQNIDKRTDASQRTRARVENQNQAQAISQQAGERTATRLARVDAKTARITEDSKQALNNRAELKHGEKRTAEAQNTQARAEHRNRIETANTRAKQNIQTFDNRLSERRAALQTLSHNPVAALYRPEKPEPEAQKAE